MVRKMAPQDEKLSKAKGGGGACSQSRSLFQMDWLIFSFTEPMIHSRHREQEGGRIAEHGVTKSEKSSSCRNRRKETNCLGA